MGKQILDEAAMKKLPCGCTTLSKIRENNAIYVDKTAYVSSLARNDARPVVLSRPGHFGKSLLVSVFESLFSRGLEDFRGLAIENDPYWKNEETYKVVRLDFSQYATVDLETFKSSLTRDIQCVLKNKKEEELTDSEKSVPVTVVLSQYDRMAEIGSLVLLVDEYDAPLNHNRDNPEQLKKFSDFLNSFLATIKSCGNAFRFVFITGITRLSQASIFSTFNHHLDITMDDDHSGLLGFTESELHTYFDPYVRNAASVLDISASDVYAIMKSTYGGYQFSFNAEETVYDPWSVLSFLKNPEKGFADYWYLSGGTPTALVQYLKDADIVDLLNMLRYRDGLPEGVRTLVDEDLLLSKTETGQTPVNMQLLKAGYFTLKSVCKYLAELVIPNDEIAESLIKLSLDIHSQSPTPETVKSLDRVSEFADAEDIDSLFKLFNSLLCECVSSSSKVFNDENSVRDVIYSQIPRRGIYKAREVINSQGYSDLELKTARTKLVVEFKRIQESGGEESALKDAISQMRTHHYGETTEDIKLIRAAMIICTASRSLTAYRVME